MSTAAWFNVLPLLLLKHQTLYFVIWLYDHLLCEQHVKGNDMCYSVLMYIDDAKCIFPLWNNVINISYVCNYILYHKYLIHKLLVVCDYEFIGMNCDFIDCYVECTSTKRW